MKINWRMIGHIIFWIGLLTSLFGAFEIAYDLGRYDPDFHPIWSGLMGPPFMHHYLYGYIISILGYFLLCKADYITERLIYHIAELKERVKNVG